jgi:RHS repeat-associated protein
MGRQNGKPGHPSRTQVFTYDVLNRISSGQSSGTYWGENFTIDAWGNLTNETGISGKTNSEGLNVSVGTNNRFLTSSGFTYDAAGNLSSQQSGPTYRYDAENRLVYTSAGGYNYYYDGDGNRVAKSNGTTGTAYWRGPTGDPIFESSLTGTNQEEYIFFNGSRVARMDVGSNAAHYYFSDELGSSAVVETANGSSCEQDIDYYPYGGVMSDFCPNIAQHYRFNGKERDTETGLDNFGARYNASSLGRFMTPDWAAKPVTVPYAKFGDPQSLNLYSYVENGPVNRIDPDGHDDAGGGGESASTGDTSGGSGDEGTNGGDQRLTADKKGATQNSDPTAPPPPPTPDPAGVRTDPALNPSNPNPSTTNTPADQTQAPMESRGQQPKGERNTTSKPEFKDKPGKLPKGVKPNPDKPGEYLVKDPHTGNWKPKPPGWSPYAQQIGIGAAIVTGAVITGHAIAGCFASGACEAGIAIAF